MSTQGSSNMMYFFGKKIRQGQVWKDYYDVEYNIESVSPEESSVNIRSSDGRSFIESAQNLIASCELCFDPIKNKEDLPSEE